MGLPALQPGDEWWSRKHYTWLTRTLLNRQDGWLTGHLAPSADFRWSQKALSESYFYSNMSPERPEFNRGIWGESRG